MIISYCWIVMRCYLLNFEFIRFGHRLDLNNTYLDFFVQIFTKFNNLGKFSLARPVFLSIPAPFLPMATPGLAE